MNSNLVFLNNFIFKIDKPLFLTCNEILLKINLHANLKIGHIGTLDPLANGLFIFCINNSIINITKLLNLKKKYLVFSILGVSTDTLDLSGKINFFFDDFILLRKRNFKKFLNFYILKKKKQKLTLFSSLKHNNKQIYKYARLEINLYEKKNSIKLYNIFLIMIKNNFIIFEIDCSKGTYIREVINMLGCHLRVPLCVYKITRLKIGNYSILNAFSYNDCKKMFFYFN